MNIVACVHELIFAFEGRRPTFSIFCVIIVRITSLENSIKGTP